MSGQASPPNPAPQDRPPADQATVDQAPVDQAPADQAPVVQAPADQGLSRRLLGQLAAPVRRMALFPVDRPRTTLLVTALLAIAAMIGVARIRADASLDALFARDDPAALALTRVLNHFSATEELLILVSLPDSAPTPAPDPDRLLAFAERFEGAVARSPEASVLTGGVIWRADAQSRQFFERELVPAGLYYLDDPSFAAARQRLTKAQMREQIARNEAMASQPGPAGQGLAKALLQDPLHLHEFILQRLVAQRPFKTYQGSEAFIAPTGRDLLIRVVGKRSPSDLNYCKAMVSAVQRAAESANSDGLKIRYTGSYAIAAASEKSIRADSISSIISSVLFMLVLFVAAYRRPIRLFHLAFAPVALGTLAGFGIYGFVAGVINPMTAVIGGILAGMGIDYSVLYLSQYESSRGEGAGPAEACRRTMLTIGTALFAAWITSIIGFLAVGSSSVRALHDFSILGTLGLGGSFLAAVMVLPALLVMIDRRRETAGQRGRFRLRPEPLLRWIADHRRACVAGAVTVAAAALASVVSSPGKVLQLESDLRVMHPQPNPALDAQAEIAKLFGTAPDSLIVHLQADSPQNLVRLAHEVERRLSSPDSKTAGINGAYGLATLLPDPAIVPARRAAVSPADAERIIADFKEAIADSIFKPEAYAPYAEFLRTLLTRQEPPDLETLLKYPSLARNLLPSSAFAAGATPPTEAIALVFLNHPTEDRAARDAAVDFGRKALAGASGATLTGIAVVGHDAEITVRRDLPRLILAAVVLVGVYLLIHFRRPLDMLMALVPAGFSLLCLAAVVRLTGQKLNMINLVSLPLLIGVDVDYGIYLVSLARIRGSANHSVADVISRLASGTHAVIVCAMSVILGFGSLVFTSVPAVRSLGMVMAVGVISCLAGTLFLLVPVLLQRKGRDASGNG